MQHHDGQTALSIQRLEERLAWLQKHVAEQDKAILELAETVDRLGRDLAEIRERSAQSEPSQSAGDTGLSQERPPHY